MAPQALRTARYRFRATFGGRWPGYLAIVLLVGLLGGLAMGSLAAARRTQASFATFLASTNPSDLTLAVFPTGPATSSGVQGGYSGSLTSIIRHLPGVRRVESWVEGSGLPLDSRGAPRLSTGSDLTVVGSVDGLSFNVDRATALQGRMADPAKPDEFVTTPAGAQLSGWRVGQVVPFGFYTSAQFGAPNFTSGAVTPTIRVEAKLVGIVQFSDSVVQDQVDRYPTFAVFTPALTDRLVRQGLTFATYYGIQTTQGSRNVAAVERALSRDLPGDADYQVHLTSLSTARTERAIKPASIALGVFGLIAALAALVIGAQAVGRQLRAGQPDLEVLRALGADSATTMSDGLVGALGSLVPGALVACGVAVALSPIGPIGPVRSVYPERGFAVDWTVFGLGVAVVIAVLGGLTVVLAYRLLPQRLAMRRAQAAVRRPGLANAAADAGLSAPAVAGVRFAFEPGDRRRPVPVHSALVGTALAVVVVVATLTFGSGLSTLVSHPPLYGWNWSYALFSETGPDVPPQAVALLRHDHDVAAFSEASTADPLIDGRPVPGIFEPAGAAVAPPILSGHAPQTNDQIVLGAATLSELHTHVGGTVTASYGNPKNAPLYVPPKVLHVVGTTTFPAIGFPSSEGDHTSMGTGALVPSGLVSAAFRQASESPDPTLDGPEFVFVRIRGGVSQAVGRADMRRIALAANRAFAAAPDGDGTGDTVLVSSNLLPAEIVNYKLIGATPALLAGSLALGAVVALGLILVSSVRRRDREIALLKTLGFTRRQISASVGVQATVIGFVGLLAGIPLGIVLGRWLWVLFAHQIYAVPAPTIPVAEVAIVGIATLFLVNLVALLPGRAASRTPTALVLRGE